MIVTLPNVTFTDDVGVYLHKRRYEVRVYELRLLGCM